MWVKVCEFCNSVLKEIGMSIGFCWFYDLPIVWALATESTTPWLVHWYQYQLQFSFICNFCNFQDFLWKCWSLVPILWKQPLVHAWSKKIKTLQFVWLLKKPWKTLVMIVFTFGYYLPISSYRSVFEWSSVIWVIALEVTHGG